MNEEIEEILKVLILMYEQYCQDGHNFMTAGEQTQIIFDKYGVKTDMAGRIIYPLPKNLIY